MDPLAASARLMGWRASTLLDLIVVALVRHGPHTIKQLGERLSKGRYHDEWVLLYGPGWPQKFYGEKEDGKRGYINGPAPVGYTDLYQRLKKLEKGNRVYVGLERGPSNAIMWCAPTRADKEAKRAALAQRLRIPGELREQAADAAAKIGCTVKFEANDERGYVVMTTPRGPVRVDGPPQQSWWDAAIDLGLA